MRIASLKQVTAEHVTVIFADETEVKSTLGVVTELRLFSGKELDECEAEALIRDSRRALMREKALELVSQRQMSARELNRKLRDKGADEETADYCVQWILERGLIDEERYAAAIVLRRGSHTPGAHAPRRTARSVGGRIGADAGRHIEARPPGRVKTPRP